MWIPLEDVLCADLQAHLFVPLKDGMSFFEMAQRQYDGATAGADCAASDVLVAVGGLILSCWLALAIWICREDQFLERDIVAYPKLPSVWSRETQRGQLVEPTTSLTSI